MIEQQQLFGIESLGENINVSTEPITITYYDGGNRPMNMYLTSIALGNRSERNALSLYFYNRQKRDKATGWYFC